MMAENYSLRALSSKEVRVEIFLIFEDIDITKSEALSEPDVRKSKEKW